MSDDAHIVPEGTDPSGPLPAGDFASWVAEIRGAIRGDNPADVACDGCTACCTSSQFVHIAPDETATLARIPADLLFPAPRMPRGHVLLGYDDRGHCPMLRDRACSIYDDRPRTCRTYDCRVFAAAGLSAVADDKPDIDRRARLWEFSYATDADRARHDAVRTAATALREHPDLLPDDAARATTTQLAVLAVLVHDALIPASTAPTAAAIAAELTRHRPTPLWQRPLR